MQQFHMKLATEPYNKIASGEKVIESRLYDEKRQQIAIGDEIVFSEKDYPEHTARTRVTDLLRYVSFKELFADYDAAFFGCEDKHFLLSEIKQFYSNEDEQKNGVVGIRIQLVDQGSTYT